MKLRRIALVLTVASLAATATASAQTVEMMTMGLRGGVNQSSVSVNVEGRDVDPASQTAYHVSGLLGLAFSEKVAMMLEIQYVGKGFEDVAESGTTLDLDLKYLNLPLVAVVTLPVADGPIAPRFYAGPALGYRISCHLDSNESPDTRYTDCDGDISKDVDFSIFVGGGVKIGKGYGGLTIDVSYDYSLSNFNESDAGGELKNRNLLLSIGFLAAII
jgi:hypothetical protein